MNLQHLWRWMVTALTATSTTPDLDAELLLSKYLQLSSAQLYSYAATIELPLSQQQTIEAAVKRRLTGEPMAYLLGEQEFWSLSLEVNNAVLIPRPETELLVELLISYYDGNEKKVADLGTGSGAVALALASERPAWKIIATDYSKQALQVAQRNLRRYQYLNIELRQGSWCDAFNEGELFHAIVSNPPYIAMNDPHLQSELGLCFEPKSALISGENGLSDLIAIIYQASYHLYPGGHLIVEHGYNQASSVRQLFVNYGYHSVIEYKDLAGQQRVTSGKWH